MTPHALTREQMERLIQQVDPSSVGSSLRAELRQAFAQQAQEVERWKQLEKNRRDEGDHLIQQLNEIKETVGETEFSLRQQLAAMTAERDEAIDETASLRASCHAFDLQVQELQARVKELEAQYAHELEEVNRQKRLDLASECDRLRNIIRELQATLAEREARINELERLLQGDLDVQRMEFTPETGLNLHASHPLMAAIAEGMVRFFHDAGGINYVELDLVHKTEGAYTLTVQKKTDAKTPHELRREAESDLAIALQDAARLRMLIFRLLNDLPTNRDWLDPDLEKALRGEG